MFTASGVGPGWSQELERHFGSTVGGKDQGTCCCPRWAFADICMRSCWSWNPVTPVWEVGIPHGGLAGGALAACLCLSGVAQRAFAPWVHLCLLAHFPNGCSVWGWVRLKLGAWYSTHVCHMGASALSVWATFCCLRRCINGKMEGKWSSWWEIQYQKQRLKLLSHNSVTFPPCQELSEDPVERWPTSFFLNKRFLITFRDF